MSSETPQFFPQCICGFKVDSLWCLDHLGLAGFPGGRRFILTKQNIQASLLQTPPSYLPVIRPLPGSQRCLTDQLCAVIVFTQSLSWLSLPKQGGQRSLPSIAISVFTVGAERLMNVWQKHNNRRAPWRVASDTTTKWRAHDHKPVRERKEEGGGGCKLDNVEGGRRE